jgi:hypothetical protein
MSDGRFNQGSSEQFQQSGITRERSLIVSTSPTGDIPIIVVGNNTTLAAASSYASLDPNDTSMGALDQLGPHFVMSPQTPDGSHSYGFKVCLGNLGLLDTAAVALPGTDGLPGFTITPWILLGSLQIQNLPRAYRQQWASLAPAVDAKYFEWWHTFDLNACAVRFQIGNIATHGLINLIFAEL